MKTLILAAFVALSFTAIAAQAAQSGRTQSNYHQGPYDNTGNSPGETGLEGGGG